MSHVPFGICISYLEKCLFISSAHFFNQVDTFICFYGFFHTWRMPFSIFFFNKGGLVMNSLSFHLFEQVFNCSSLLKASILGWLFKKIFWISHHIVFWPTKFLLRNPPIVLWEFPCMWQVTFLLLLSKFSLWLLTI